MIPEMFLIVPRQVGPRRACPLKRADWGATDGESCGRRLAGSCAKLAGVPLVWMDGLAGMIVARHVSSHRGVIAAGCRSVRLKSLRALTGELARGSRESRTWPDLT